MTVRNRLVMSPMETLHGTSDGLPSRLSRNYFAARAQGGVGLITLDANGVDPQHPEKPGGLHLGTDAAVDAHRALVSAVHEHGAKIRPQIVHAGTELHAAPDYMLLGSFLASQRNRRTDDYRGDSVHGRIQRIVVETLAAIRSEVGDVPPITLRISGYERVAGGRPIHETAQVAPERWPPG